MDVLKIEQAYEDQADPASDPPKGIADIPLFDSFFNHEDRWERIHVHLIGVRPQDDTPTSETDGIKAPARRLFGVLPTPFAGYVHPSVKVETVGKDTGSTDYFKVGEHSFTTKKNALLPSWDERTILLGKKGSEFTSGIQLTMINESNTQDILRTTIERPQFPEPGEGWKQFLATAEDSATEQFDGLELRFKIKVTSCTEKIVSKQDIASMCNDTEDIAYTEEVITGGEQEVDRALLQCWRHQPSPATKAVLWIIGRNDCFMHPHVHQHLFLEQGYDIYILNWSANGMCRKRGWLKDAFMNSHNRTGNADLYIPQVHDALSIIQQNQPYQTLLGYAHSTGGCILAHYVLNRGDSAFSGFILNSAMFDLAQVDAMFPLVEKTASVLDFLGLKNTDSSVFSSLIPYGQQKSLQEKIQELGLEEHHLRYLGQDIEVGVWYAKLWSQYQFDGRARPFYRTPITVGFLQFVAQVTATLDRMHREKKHLTLKPIICFATRLDDTLSDYSLTHRRVDTLGPSRCEIEMRHNAHDVFLSDDREDNVMAMELIKTWMRNNGL